MKRAFILITIFLLSSCRKDAPPPLDPYVQNGFGTAIYKNPDTGVVIKKLPSEIRGWACFDPQQLKPFAEWCFNPDN